MISIQTEEKLEETLSQIYRKIEYELTRMTANDFETCHFKFPTTKLRLFLNTNTESDSPGKSLQRPTFLSTEMTIKDRYNMTNLS